MTVFPGRGMNSAEAIHTVTPGSVEQEGGSGRMHAATVPEGGVRDASRLLSNTLRTLSASCFLAAYAYPSRPSRFYGWIGEGNVDSNGFGLYLINVYGNKRRTYLSRSAVGHSLSHAGAAPAASAHCCRANGSITAVGHLPPDRRVCRHGGRAAQHGEMAAGERGLPWPLDQKPGLYKWAWTGMYEKSPSVTGWNPVRVIGLAPVESDGSADFRPPTCTPARCTSGPGRRFPRSAADALQRVVLPTGRGRPVVTAATRAKALPRARRRR